MYSTTPQFHKGDRVKLKATIDPSIYGEYAVSGNEGFVADTRINKLGFQEIFIKWDIAHWAYNGIPNCWTVEDHFDLILPVAPESQPEKSKEEHEKDDKKTIEAYKQWLEKFKQTVLAASSESDEADQMLADAVTLAYQHMENAKAFIVICVEEDEVGNLVPGAMMHASSPEAELIATAFLSTLVADFYQELALQRLNQDAD
jgi:hypothetical protein